MTEQELREIAKNKGLTLEDWKIVPHESRPTKLHLVVDDDAICGSFFGKETVTSSEIRENFPVCKHCVNVKYDPADYRYWTPESELN